MNRYGYAPDAEDCTPRPAPAGLQTRMTQQYLGFKPKMIPALNRRLPTVVVARQLLKAYPPARDDNTIVGVEGYGVFRLGIDGWCLDLPEPKE